MSDDAFVEALQAIFDADDPSDGIDRGSGFGSTLRVTSLARVDDGDFPELEVTYELDLPRRPRFRHVPRRATTRVLFGQEWLTASGYTSAAAYAPEVAAEVQVDAVNHVDDVIEGRRRRRVDPDDAARSVPAEDELWQTLLTDLRSDHLSAEEVSTGVIELVATWLGGDGKAWVHVTPAQWRHLVVECEVAARRDRGIDASSAGDGPGLAWFHLHEEIGSLDEGERHVVHFRGGFHRSIRSDLPPVRDRSPVLPLGEGRGWLAFGPEDGR